MKKRNLRNVKAWNVFFVNRRLIFPTPDEKVSIKTNISGYSILIT